MPESPDQDSLEPGPCVEGDQPAEREIERSWVCLGGRRQRNLAAGARAVVPRHCLDAAWVDVVVFDRRRLCCSGAK